MKNKKADIPVTVLVIGVFAVCTLAIFSFVYSEITARNSFIGIDLMEQINSGIDKFHTYIKAGVSPTQAATFSGATWRTEQGEGVYERNRVIIFEKEYIDETWRGNDIKLFSIETRLELPNN